MPRREADSSPAAAQRGGGRPRDESVDEAILKAAVRLLHDEGFARMSIAGVAEEAGVGRPAIEFMRAKVPAPDTGDTRQDLVTHLELARRTFDVSLSGTLLVEEEEHPE